MSSVYQIVLPLYITEVKVQQMLGVFTDVGVVGRLYKFCVSSLHVIDFLKYFLCILFVRIVTYVFPFPNDIAADRPFEILLPYNAACHRFLRQKPSVKIFLAAMTCADELRSNVYEIKKGGGKWPRCSRRRRREWQRRDSGMCDKTK
ncbi:hypothetical protein TRVL_02599 [Trypanosoma vivax]|uniref:Uncharacterized protein n=1 Tax=Trypanosoma vivax (strain Y486) TaxID=1055687 RepID=G0U9M8_TRYVY|nr:hypothetical protein TRVL_02599 [Trypanosoma vivax]CCC54314.1 hypothetical protein TVY486_1117980 [Trypanosoma vivax Y486]